MSSHTCAFDCLTDFEYEDTVTGNGNGLPDDTEEGEMASELLGGVGVLVFTCWPPRPVEVEFG